MGQQWSVGGNRNNGSGEETTITGRRRSAASSTTAGEWGTPTLAIIPTTAMEVAILATAATAMSTTLAAAVDSTHIFRT